METGAQNWERKAQGKPIYHLGIGCGISPWLNHVGYTLLVKYHHPLKKKSHYLWGTVASSLNPKPQTLNPELFSKVGPIRR